MNKRIYAYTITRADTVARSRLLLDTLTRGRDTADYPFTWHVHVNGRGIMAQSMVESCFVSKVIDSFEVSEYNEGQHPPANKAIAKAITENYDYILRTDDDVEWLSKRWLAKLVEASEKIGGRQVLSPRVRGLRWLPPMSQTVEVEGIPIKIINFKNPIGGICRLIPVPLLRDNPYFSDVRLPLGGGDADGIGKWVSSLQPLVISAYCQHVNIRHAKGTDQQEKDDPIHAKEHDMLQHVPYIPLWSDTCPK